VFRPKKNWTKLCNTLALPALLYGSENWTIKARDATRITAAEMKDMRRTAGYAWTDHKTNTEIAKELNITLVLDKIQDYRRKWIQHVNRMPHNRLPRLIKNYTPKGKSNH
jgi:ABC-type ATPase involved in cell division